MEHLAVSKHLPGEIRAGSDRKAHLDVQAPLDVQACQCVEELPQYSEAAESVSILRQIHICIACAM